MSTTGQWAFYRQAEGKLLRAPLPSAPEAGEGWRGVELRRFHPLEQLDDLIEDTSTKVDVALGVAVVDSAFAYVVASERHGDPLRLILGLEASAAHERGSDARARAGVPKRGTKGWGRSCARGLARWSAFTPNQLRPEDIEDLLGEEPSDAVESARELLRLLGLELPAEAIPDPLDLQSVAREQAARQPEKRGLFRRR